MVLQDYVPEKVRIITIAEIDFNSTLDTASAILGSRKKKLFHADRTYTMGLGGTKSGLKLTPKKLHSKEKAIHALQNMDDKRLVKQFFKQTYFIPGYIQSDEQVLGFLSLAASNQKLQEERKNVIFYFNNYRNMFKKNYFDEDTEQLYSHFSELIRDKKLSWHQAFHDADIQSITIIDYGRKSPSKEIIEFHSSGREMTIITSILFCDSDYELMYDIPQHFTLASGDNSLENAINHGLLFLMQFKYQYQTVRQIAKIAEKYNTVFEFSQSELPPKSPDSSCSYLV